MRIGDGGACPESFRKRRPGVNERTVFLNALERTNSAERQAYLDEACAGNLALRERVEALLQAHEREGRFLDVPVPEQMAAPGVRPERTSDYGKQGPWEDEPLVR